MDDFTVEKIDRYSGSSSLKDTFPTYQISNGKIGYELHFHVRKESTTLISLPYVLGDNQKYNGKHPVNQTMKISLDGGATLEMPFTRGILDDEFMSFCARLIIGNNNIIFDCEEFNEDMFPERDECHC